MPPNWRAQPLLHPLLEALGPEHIVHREAGADVPDKVDVVEVQEPVGVVDHHGLAFAELDEPLHLLLEAVAVVLDGIPGHHGAQIRAAGGVADHGRAAADQRDGAVAGHLEAFHQAQGHKVAHMEGIRCGIEADIEGSFALVDETADFFLVRDLGDEAPGHQFFIECHGNNPF